VLKFISYFLAYLVLTEAWRALRSPRARIRWRKLRRSDFALAVPLVLAVFGVGTLLYRIAPALRWGWWSWLGGGQGTALQGTTPALTHTTPLALFLVPVLMPLLLVIALPAMVHAEERGFRRGAEHSRDRRQGHDDSAAQGLSEAGRRSAVSLCCQIIKYISARFLCGFASLREDLDE